MKTKRSKMVSIYKQFKEDFVFRRVVYFVILSIIFAASMLAWRHDKISETSESYSHWPSI